MSAKTLYHTTPIYYVNDVPHVGHAYTTIAADALARARRLAGQRVFYLTGTDEHGQNIQRIAREKGLAPQAYCDGIAARFRALWQRYDLRYDGFIRTTDAVHKRGVLELWRRLRAAVTPDGRPAIYEGTYAGWYCPRCEGFKTDDELSQPGHLCPDHERPCEWTEEQNYFFRLSAYSTWLREEIESGRIRIDPEGRRNEVLAVIRQGLQDFSISRARVKWGIPVPERPDHVFYVWMDALSNYVTALGFGEDGEAHRPYVEFWERADERLHLIGKEIIRFHCLYWPAMLRAAGVPPPTRLYAHGHLTKNGKKLSKTTGNVIDPEALVARYGPDAVRYFLLREGTFGQDWDYTDQAFVKRYNADLANDLGNLVSRALTMVQRYCDGKVPPRPAGLVHALHATGQRPETPVLEVRAIDEFQDATTDGLTYLEAEGRRILERYEQLDFAGALVELWQRFAEFNRDIVAFEPWAKAKDPAQREALQAFLYRLLEAVRAFGGVWLYPVMPRAAGRVFRMLGLDTTDPIPADLAWGRLEPGRPLGTVEPLFPRLESVAPSSAPSETQDKKQEKPVSEIQPPAPAGGAPVATSGPAGAADAAVAPAVIDISEFARLDLRVGRVVAAQAVPKSKKLVKLQIDLGESEPRQVVAGIADAYAPDALVGRTVVVVANLKPAKLMGVESRGMVLAASIEGQAALCTIDQPAAPGTKVK